MTLDRPSAQTARNPGPFGALRIERTSLGWTDSLHAKAIYAIARIGVFKDDLAVEAAHGGFDEVQFDYVRFPDSPGLVFSEPGTQANRVAAIVGFLALARDTE